MTRVRRLLKPKAPVSGFHVPIYSTQTYTVQPARADEHQVSYSGSPGSAKDNIQYSNIPPTLQVIPPCSNPLAHDRSRSARRTRSHQRSVAPLQRDMPALDASGPRIIRFVPRLQKRPSLLLPHCLLWIISRLDVAGLSVHPEEREPGRGLRPQGLDSGSEGRVDARAEVADEFGGGRGMRLTMVPVAIWA